MRIRAVKSSEESGKLRVYSISMITFHSIHLKSQLGLSVIRYIKAILREKMTELGSNKSVQLQRLTKILHEASLLAVRKHQSQVFSRRGPFQYIPL